MDYTEATAANLSPRRWLLGATSRRELVISGLKLLDSVILIGSFGGAALLVSFQADVDSLESFLSMRMKVGNLVVFAALVFLWRAGFRAFGLYRPTDQPFSRDRIRDTFLATTTAVLCVGVCGYAADISIVSFPFLIVFGALANGLVLSSRFLLVSLLALRDSTGLQRRILVVGTGPQAIRFARRIDTDPDEFSTVIGFCDEPWRGIGEFHALGLELVTDPKTFRSFLRANVVDEVAIAVPLSALTSFESDMLQACEEHGVNVRFLSSIFTDLGVGSGIGNTLGDKVVVSWFNGKAEGRQVLVKRALDITLAALLLTAAIPLFIGVAIAIRRDSRGRVLFEQTRVGLNKRLFRMYKFRSMAPNAEERMADVEHLNQLDGPVFKIEDDPRVTRVGRWLRSTSIDELPQLINVLKGEMSLVGPRPLPLRDFEGFDDDRFRRRFSVVPGLTGLWQVSGRSMLDFEDWMELDLEYVDNWSLGLDFKILLKTLPTVLRRVGAH
jgi:exopolysaccharide biosynthesis polyprenyl glycosylphosphotransferase